MDEDGRGRRGFGGAMVLALTWVLCPVALLAAVERYKVEADYLARLAQLGCTGLVENFEGSDWDGLRSIYPNQSVALSNTTQRVTWSSAGHDLWPSGEPSYITTNPNWARGDGWGIFDTYLASTIRIRVPEPIYGVGLWVDSNPDLQDIGFLFPGRTTADSPGYVLPGYGAMYPGDNPGAGHQFIGIIDPDGFTDVIITGTLQLTEDGQLEGMAVFGSDDHTLAVAPGFILTPLQQWRLEHFSSADLGDPGKEVTVWGDDADPDHDAISNWREYVFGGDPRVADAAAATLSTMAGSGGGGPRLRFSYNRRTNDPGVRYAPEVSADLKTWYAGSTYVEEIGAVSLGNHMERVTCQDTGVLASGGSLFGKVEAVGAPR